MAKLTTSERKAIPSGEFALPDRRYPIPDKSHAANARARVDQFGSPTEKKAVFSKTAKFFKKKSSSNKTIPFIGS